jgi:hypothetical protein
VKYAFIHRHRRVWPISVQCRVLQVSVAGYHEHFVRRASDAQRRHLSDDSSKGNVNPYTGKEGTKDPYQPSQPKKP